MREASGSEENEGCKMGNGVSRSLSIMSSGNAGTGVGSKEWRRDLDPSVGERENWRVPRYNLS